MVENTRTLRGGAAATTVYLTVALANNEGKETANDSEEGFFPFNPTWASPLNPLLKCGPKPMCARKRRHSAACCDKLKGTKTHCQKIELRGEWKGGSARLRRAAGSQ